MFNFYLLYGDDKSFIGKEIQKIKNNLSILDDDVINYDINNVNDIIEEARTIGMFSSVKLIVIDATSYLYGKKEVKDITLLEDYFNSYNPDSYLVFTSYSSSVDSRRSLVKNIKKIGTIINALPTLEYLNNYVSNYLKENNYLIEGSTIDLFLSNVGTNIDNITNELDKLMLYKLEDKKITEEDVTNLVDVVCDNPMYELVGYILKGNTKEAINIYNRFILDGMDPNQILISLAGQVRLLFQVKRLYNQGKSKEEIANILDIKNVYRVKYLINDTYYYTEDMLLKYLSKLADIDWNIKFGKIDADTFIELFILEKDM